MARIVYACRFDIATSNRDSVIQSYFDWIAHTYATRYKQHDIEIAFQYDRPTEIEPLPGHKVSYKNYHSDDKHVLEILWNHPSDLDNSLQWQNKVRLGFFQNLISLEHVITIDSIDYKVAPAPVILGAPSVIQSLCSKNVVQVGDMRILATPYKFALKDIDKFLELLQSPNRKLPIVFLSPYASDQENKLGSSDLAQHLAGIAVVVEATSTEVTWEIGKSLGRLLSCFNGGARIYWPGFKQDDSPKQHPLYLSTKIEAVGSDTVRRAIERTIFSVASIRFSPSPKINAIVRSALESERAERVVSQKGSSNLDWEEYALELDEKLKAATIKVNELEAENANLRENQKFVYTPSTENIADQLSNDTAERNPTTNLNAVEFARIDFKNLEILDSAISSAKDSPFFRPQDIYDALRDLNKVADNWASQRLKTGSGGDIRRQLADEGWGKRCSMHISDTTRTKYGEHYTFEYKGEKVLFEPHITLGSGDANNCASIHFIADNDANKFIVAHVGRHLPNTRK